MATPDKRVERSSIDMPHNRSSISSSSLIILNTILSQYASVRVLAMLDTSTEQRETCKDCALLESEANKRAHRINLSPVSKSLSQPIFRHQRTRSLLSHAFVALCKTVDPSFYITKTVAASAFHKTNGSNKPRDGYTLFSTAIRLLLQLFRITHNV